VSLINELKRRNVFKVGVAYIIVAWLLAQVADLMVDNFGAPDWVMKSFLGFLIIGFPLAVFFAWAFELTPEGVKRESQVDRSQSITSQTGQKLNHAIMFVMALALAWFAWDRFGAAPEATAPAEPAKLAAEQPVAAPASNVKSLAVLPFVAMSSGADDEYFADGLTEEILNSLAQLPELLVTARTSAFHFKGQEIPVQEIAAKLGVGHIVEGSVRRSGDRLRVTAQLIRAADGFHLWSENYDSSSADTIEVQENIAEKIAVALDVVMSDQKREAMSKAGLKDVEAFIALQKAREFFEDAHGEAEQIPALRQANSLFEAVIEKVPAYAPAYIEHSDLYIHILFNTNTGQTLPGVTEEDVAQALELATRDYTTAAQYARNFEERNNIDFDLAFLSGNWRGLNDRVERHLRESGCLQANWSPPVAVPYGHAETFLVRAKEFLNCDRMSPSAWFDLARATWWAGDPAEATRIGREGMETAPGHWLALTVIWSLAASGEFEEASSVASLYITDDTVAIATRIMIAAAKGDRENAEALMEIFRKDHEDKGFWAFMLYAWMGERDQINRLAAEIDQRVFGPQSLMILNYWCACGAPFDLSATPNFAAKFAESGLVWPPASPIKLPFKDW
jgi:TolB-like protein